MLGHLLSFCILGTRCHFVKNVQFRMLDDIEYIYIYIYIFHGTFFMNLIVSAFYVDECMNFKVYEFYVYECMNLFNFFTF
jgi:hypothetical protein